MVFIIQGRQLLDRKSSSWNVLKVWMEWWPSLKLAVPHRTNDPTWPVLLGGGNNCAFNPTSDSSCFFVESNSCGFASASHVGLHETGISVFLEFTQKTIGIMFTLELSGRRQSTWTLGFGTPFEALEVLDALRKHWLQSLGPMHEPSPVPGLQEEISVGWGLGSLWVEWRNTSFSTWAHAKYTKNV